MGAFRIFSKLIDLLDISSANLPALNTPLSDALDAKLDKASSITITGTTPAPTEPLIEIAPVNGKRSWNNDEGWEIYYDSGAWILSQNGSEGDYEAAEYSTTEEPWKLTNWNVNVGTGEPTLAIDPPDISPIGATGTRALTDRQDGKVNVTSVAGTLPVANGGTGGTNASTARTNLGAGTAGNAIFQATTYTGTGSVRKLCGLDVDDSPAFSKVRSVGAAGTPSYASTTATTTGIEFPQNGMLGLYAANGRIALVRQNLFEFSSGVNVGWCSGTAYDSSQDTGLRRNAAGVVEVNNATAGQFRDLKLRNLISTQYIEGAEMTAPAAPAANGFRIFAEDNGSGKTRLMVQFATGAAQQIAIEP